MVLGAAGERFVAEFLLAEGYELIQQNWRGSHGEVDLIMCHDVDIVFIEVKTRSTVEYGDPLSAVRRKKLQRLRTLALEWLHEHDVWGSWRIDVVGLVGTPQRGFEIRHLMGV